jgi:xanthosine phosphorylase
VGAAVRTPSGRVFAGCNVENAAYPQTQCAEATAIGAMVAAGEYEIAEIAVVAAGETPCSPCGGCRQRLAEFGRPETRVHMAGPDGPAVTVTLGELLPHAFGASWMRQQQPLPEQTADPELAEAATLIRRRVPGVSPRIAIVLGSGLGTVADRVSDATSIDYRDLRGFPWPGVQGHAGRLVLGHLAGIPVACLSGRAHLYEGIGSGPLTTIVRTLATIGCRVLVLTNAAGSLRPDLGPGSLVLIEDHINLQGTNPLVGPHDAGSPGPRFLDLSEVYARSLREILVAAAQRLGLVLGGGVYLATLGPCFETPAEIRAFRSLGADLVGMSTVPEAISARQLGLQVAAVSVVTNLAAGLTAVPLSHTETLARSANAAGDIARLLETALPEIDRAIS